MRTARASVERWLDDAPARVRDDARSVVTELVANAVQYGRPPIHLTVERHANDWRIDVADGGNRRFGRRARTGEAGWGLRIVGGLAESWGIAEDGSRVWCRLRADSGEGNRAPDPAGRATPGAAAGQE